MADTFDDGARYLNRSQRVRETLARHQLNELLRWAFASKEILAMDPADLADFLQHRVRPAVVTVAPEWSASMKEATQELGMSDLLTLEEELASGFTTIRAIAHAVASNEPTDAVRLTLEMSIPPAAGGEYERQPRWRILRGGLDDALGWVAVRLFCEVPRSLIRKCGTTGCPRVYVASKNQKYCPHHQREAQRQTQRRAEQAFRARAARKKKGKKKL